MFIQNSATFLGGTAVGFQQGWHEALLLTAALPFIAGASAWMARVLAECDRASDSAYADAGAAAAEALGAVRTVAALCGEQRESVRYAVGLRDAFRAGVRRARAAGMGFAAVMGSLFATFALGMWCVSTKMFFQAKSGLNTT